MKTEESKIIQAAWAAKIAGYRYMASVVKSYRSTTYYHVVPIDEIIEAGKWPAAPLTQFPSGAVGRRGMSKLPESTILRQEAYQLV